MGKLHDCKRGLDTATPSDYNRWWRERTADRACIAELEAKFSEKYWDEVGVEMLQLKEVIQRMHESVERWDLGLIDEQDCLDLLCKGLEALLPENQHE